MTPPDVFCMHCKIVFDGFEAYQEHLNPVDTTAEVEDDE